MRRALWACFLAAWALPAQPRLVPCPGTAPDRYNVLLDDISYQGPGGRPPVDRQVLDLLSQKLKQDLEQLRLETRPRVSVVRCLRRLPGDETDFPVSVVDALNSRRVILEVWGSITATGAGPRLDHEARIGVVLIPIRLYERSSDQLPGVYWLRFRQRALADPNSLLALLGESTELQAYAAVAAGVKAFKENEWDQAFHCLCRGEILLGRVTGGEDRQYREAMLQYVRGLTVQTVARAQNDPAYGAGALTLVTSGRAKSLCPGGPR